MHHWYVDKSRVTGHRPLVERKHIVGAPTVSSERDLLSVVIDGAFDARGLPV